MRNVLRTIRVRTVGVVAAGILLAFAMPSSGAFGLQGDIRIEGRTDDAGGQLTVGISLDPASIDEFKAEAQRRAIEAREQSEKARAQAEQRRAELKAHAASRMDEAKLRICERREAAVATIIGRISDRGDRHIEVIGRISDRTQAFYKEQGLSIANYDALVADIVAAKATAESAAAAVREARADFVCAHGDPKGASESFALLVQSRADAVHAYRDAVKALVASVRAAAVRTSMTAPEPTAAVRTDLYKEQRV